jgi:hypothetical protein
MPRMPDNTRAIARSAIPLTYVDAGAFREVEVGGDGSLADNVVNKTPAVTESTENTCAVVYLVI